MTFHQLLKPLVRFSRRRLTVWSLPAAMASQAVTTTIISLLPTASAQTITTSIMLPIPSMVTQTITTSILLAAPSLAPETNATRPATELSDSTGWWGLPRGFWLLALLIAFVNYSCFHSKMSFVSRNWSC